MRIPEMFFLTRFNKSRLLAHFFYRVRIHNIVVKTGSLLLACFISMGNHLSAAPDEEQLIKTALVYKISKFVEWPESVLSSGQFNICVIGDNLVFSSFKILENRAIGTVPIKVVDLNKSDDLKLSCQILYLSASSVDEQIIKARQEERILTISDLEGFSEQLGIIELSIKDQRVAIKINLPNAQSSGVEILSPLLQLSTVVTK